MTRSILYGALALTSVVAVGIIPVACQSGGVGDPCTPEYEYNANYPGFSEGELFIESNSFSCGTRLCLVNHFRGRVSCPDGQLLGAPVGTTGAYTLCTGPTDTTSCAGLVGSDGKTPMTCVQADVAGPPCTLNTADTPTVCNATLLPGSGTVCTAVGGVAGAVPSDTGICECSPNLPQPVLVDNVAHYCDDVGMPGQYTLKSYVCHAPGDCQVQYPPTNQPNFNSGKQCCVPGTDTPVSNLVCPQCTGLRDAANTVYCSCRCAGTDPNYNYCSCPSGFYCAPLRQELNLGDEELVGSYCIIGAQNTGTDTAYDSAKAVGACAPSTAVSTACGTQG
jgi:hypothetical protein